MLKQFKNSGFLKTKGQAPFVCFYTFFNPQPTLSHTFAFTIALFGYRQNLFIRCFDLQREIISIKNCV